MKDEIILLGKIKEKVSGNKSWLFNCYISGSHLYEWNSQDSDIDIRGCYVLNKEELVGLRTPNEVIEIVLDDNDYDIVLFELRKMVRLAIKGNCNILEEINAKQMYKTADFVKLRQLINNSFGKKGIYNSYKGLASYNYKKFILQGRNTVKKYLYVLRGLMAGIYVLETGKIQPSIRELNKRFKIKEVDELVGIKTKGSENMSYDGVSNGKLDLIINELFVKLDKAYLKSKIPEEPSREDIEKVDKMVKRIILGG